VTRTDQEIRADLATEEGRGSLRRLSPTGRLVADVPSLLDRLAAVERQNRELRAEVARLRERDAEVRGALPNIAQLIGNWTAAEARLEAVKALAEKYRTFGEVYCDGSVIAEQIERAALSVAPQPESDPVPPARSNRIGDPTHLIGDAAPAPLPVEPVTEEKP
jgi:hypothetical protein